MATEANKINRYSLAGELSIFEVDDLIAKIGDRKKSGCLTLTDMPGGIIYFRKGEIIHASCGGKTPRVALEQMRSCQTGHFDFIEGSVGCHQTIFDWDSSGELENDEPFAIVDDFAEAPAKKNRQGLTDKILRNIQKTRFPEKTVATSHDTPEVETSGAETSKQGKVSNYFLMGEEQAQNSEDQDAAIKTRQQIRTIADQAQLGLTAKIKNILTQQKLLSVSSNVNRLKRIAQDAQMGLTAKIKMTLHQGAFAEESQEGQYNPEEEPINPFTCLFWLTGIAFLAILTALALDNLFRG